MACQSDFRPAFASRRAGQTHQVHQKYAKSQIDNELNVISAFNKIMHYFGAIFFEANFALKPF